MNFQGSYKLMETMHETGLKKKKKNVAGAAANLLAQASLLPQMIERLIDVWILSACFVC